MKIYTAALFVAVFAITAFSQTPQTTPPDNEVVRISTNLIQIDVTVTDRRGKVVTDLRSDELEVFENGKKRKISGFTFISGSRSVPVEQKPRDIDIPEPPRTIRPDQARRVFALVVDDLSMSFESAYHTRRALKRYVDEQMQDGDLVAILRTGAGVGAVSYTHLTLPTKA
jgi:VWFA-related protein